jgi:glycosyltransferase involved in cell wall biosynthesis
MSRKAVINGRFLVRRVTGVERYGREVLRWIEGNCRVEKPKRRLSGIMGHGWEQFILPSRVDSNSVLWSPANTGPLFVRNHVLTIHDLTPLEHPEWFQPGFAAWYRLLLPMLARRVSRIVVLSEFVRRKVMMRFSLPAGKITAIPAGVDTSKFHPLNVSTDMGRYILFVGSLEPRKNLFGLLKAWDEINERHPNISLVIAGTSGSAFRRLSYPSSADRVRWIGYVPETDLPALYAGAELFILPSFDEGFGLPVLEAMACGTPVIASNGGALPEMVGDAGMIFNLSNPSTLSHSISECLSNPRLRTSLREKGLARAKLFSWHTTAESVWKCLNEI